MLLRTVALLSAAAAFGAETVPTATGFVAHEWGTFTSVAGPDGNPVEWYTLGGPEKLPCFVHKSQVVFKGMSPVTVRMETPVIYFYSAGKTTVSVNVRFLAGMLTEWYPAATGANPSHLEWKDIQLLPGESLTFPSGETGNHYYAARATDAVPLRAGDEQEKLLFYRGAGSLYVPIRPRFAPDGRIELDSAVSVPAAVLFENRGGKAGYRLIPDLQKPQKIDPPELGSDDAEVQQALAAELVSAGLYPKEAQAMIDTWRDSWFEEGMRIFYLVPRAVVENSLPLTFKPAASEVTRVFVGRVELLSPAMRERIEAAVQSRDRTALAKFARFLPAFWQMMHSGPLPVIAVTEPSPCAR